MVRPWWGAAAVLIGLLVVGGCGEAPIALSAGRRLPREWLEQEYQIHPNDQLEITVWGQADLNRTIRVREDGAFSFPFLGEVPARSCTLHELEQQMARGLEQGYLVNPHVGIKLVGARFSVLGEVERPGTYPLEGRVDLLAALSMAGGLNKFGAPRVEIIRVLSDGQKASYDVDVNAILAGRQETILVHPNDTLHAKRRLF